MAEELAHRDMEQQVKSLTDELSAHKKLEQELRRTQDKLQQRLAEMSALIEGSQAVLKLQGFKAAARSVFDQCKSIIGAQSGYVALLDQEETENGVVFLDSGGLPCAVDLGLPTPIRGLREEAIKTGKVVYDNDFSNSDWGKFMPEGHPHLKNVMFVPLVVEEKTVGLLGLTNKENDFNENDVRLASAFGELTAIALKNALSLEKEKATQKAFQDSELYYRTLLHSMHEDLLVINRDFQITDVNNAYLSSSGLYRDDVIGKHCYEVLHGYSQPCNMHEESCMLKRVFQTGRVCKFRHEHCHANGSKRSVDITLSPVKDKNGDVVQVVEAIHDITGLIEIQEELRQSEERYKSLVELSPEAVLVHQAGIIKYINQSGAELFGYSNVGEMVNEPLLNLIHPDYHDNVKSRMETIYNEHTALPSQEIQCVRFDKKVIDVDTTGTYIELAGEPTILSLIRDITMRRHAENKLRENEAFMTTLIDTIPMPVFYKDRRGRYTGFNIAFETFFGKTRERLIGKSVFDINPPDLAEIYHAKDNELFENGGVQFYETQVENAQGERRDVIFKKAVFTDRKGVPQGLIGAVHDITESKRSEAERLELEARLQQAQKMEAIGTLAGGIAHDFNNILSPIMIHSEMLMMDLPAENPMKQSLNHIYTAGERARDLVKQILTFARMREEDRAPIRVSLILKEAIKLLRSTIPTTIDIRYDFQTEQDTVIADPTQINQIVMNLCANAAYAMKEKGGTLDLIMAGERIDGDSVRQSDTLNPGTYLKLSVRDTGSGIEPNTINRIFDPYFTTKGPGEGTGMGLAMVHGIVKSYGGDIAVESEPGKGTTFHVLLPAVEIEVSPQAEIKEGIPGGSERILLVDDEKAVVEIVQSMLGRLGYAVTARTSSIEALEAFRYKSESFDLVITDMTMPNMSGRDLSKEILAIRMDMPIILCTGFSDQMDEIRAEKMGISAFVMKPIVMREIAKTIRQVLDTRK